MYAAAIDHASIGRAPQAVAPPRFGRRALVMAAVVLLTALGIGEAAGWGAPSRMTTMTVRSGDTLWTIAQARYPDADAREKVYEIEQANHLKSPLIVPGQVLEVPAE